MVSYRQKVMKQTGFTLIELMVTLAVIAIVSAIAAPSFSDMIQENRAISVNNEIAGGLALARSEAIKRGERVVICQSSNQTACTNSSANWHQGWIIFHDANSNNSVGSTEEIIRVKQAVPSSITVNFSANLVRYDGDGLGADIAADQFFTICDSRGDANKRGLSVSTVGRVRQTTTSDSANLASCP